MARPTCGLAMFAALLFTAALSGPAAIAAEAGPSVEFKPSPGKVSISIGGKPFATYVCEDETISRPYFAHLRSPGGVQVTRNHPPVEGQDSPDHATFHPGLWMSFGDINGSDYWRLAAPVVFQRFIEKPQGGPGRGGFTARHAYLKQGDPIQTVCNEDLRWEVRVVPEGYLILWDSTFSSDKEFTFGDQEEMGLGFRAATPIRAEKGSEIGLAPGNGSITSSTGARNEKEIWSNSYDWCDMSGTVDGQQVGIALFPHPDNFRPSWFHARDYGMMAANPFGREAMGKGEKSAITIKPGETLRLRYGVLIHSQPKNEQLDLDAAYSEYLRLAGN